MRANQITMFTSDFKMGVINLVIKRCESKKFQTYQTIGSSKWVKKIFNGQEVLNW